MEKQLTIEDWALCIVLSRGEVWREIKGYKRYKVSNCGRVFSGKKYLKSQIESGYHRVNLYKNKVMKHFLVHRLVAEAFIFNPDKKRTVNHKDGDKQNNNILNLEWATYSENRKHALNTGLAKPQCGKDNPMYGKTGGKHHNYGKPMTDIQKTKLSIAMKKHHKLNKQKSGADAHNAKLTIEQAQELRDLYTTGEYSQDDLGVIYGISQSNVWNIVNYKTYLPEGWIDSGLAIQYDPEKHGEW